MPGNSLPLIVLTLAAISLRCDCSSPYGTVTWLRWTVLLPIRFSSRRRAIAAGRPRCQCRQPRRQPLRRDPDGVDRGREFVSTYLIGVRVCHRNDLAPFPRHPKSNLHSQCMQTVFLLLPLFRLSMHRRMCKASTHHPAPIHTTPDILPPTHFSSGVGCRYQAPARPAVYLLCAPSDLLVHVLPRLHASRQICTLTFGRFLAVLWSSGSKTA